MFAEHCFFTLSDMKGRLGAAPTELIAFVTEGPSDIQQPMLLGLDNCGGRSMTLSLLVEELEGPVR